MPSRYTPFTLKDIMETLKGSDGWAICRLDHINEYVFQIPLKSAPHIVVRIYSTIPIGANSTRECGADAIRVHAVDTSTDKGYIRNRKCLRTKNWRDNILKAARSVYEQAVARAKREANNTTAMTGGAA